MKNKLAITVALYARVSTKDKGQDTENQLKQLRAWCKKNKHKVTAEYIDKESGRKADRTQFKQLFIDARQGNFDMVLFWSLDRFSREGVRPTLSYLQQLDDANVAFRSHTEQYIDSAGMFKDAIISILATLANQEAVRQSERVRAGLERAKASGKVLGRKPLTKKQRDRISELRGKKYSIRAIATDVGISVGAVSKYL